MVWTERSNSDYVGKMMLSYQEGCLEQDQREGSWTTWGVKGVREDMRVVGVSEEDVRCN